MTAFWLNHLKGNCRTRGNGSFGKSACLDEADNLSSDSRNPCKSQMQQCPSRRQHSCAGSRGTQRESPGSLCASQPGWTPQHSNRNERPCLEAREKLRNDSQELSSDHRHTLWHPHAPQHHAHDQKQGLSYAHMHRTVIRGVVKVWKYSPNVHHR